MSHRVIADLLTARTGQELSDNRRWRIGTALSGLFRKRGIENVDHLVCLLANKGEEDLAKQVVEALLNNETYFFRDRQMYDVLADKVLPDLAEKRADSKRLSIWSAGCSTGQEALSLAIMFAERPERWTGWNISIIGTDVSEKAVAAARRGKYTQFEIQRGLGVAQMLHHFTLDGDSWKVQDHLAKAVSFRIQNLLDPPPRNSSAFDLILCRNVLLYFDRVRRGLAFDRLHDAIARDGWLMLGAGEAALGQTDKFDGSDLNSCLHQPVSGETVSDEMHRMVAASYLHKHRM